MRKMPLNNPHPEIETVKRQALRHVGRMTSAERELAAEYEHQTAYSATLEDTLDELMAPAQRHRIPRWAELTTLAAMAAAEVVVAENVVQALGLSAGDTRLVAVAVGGTATALAWLAGHEWAISRDPQVALSGKRGWMKLAGVASGAFLGANLGVRIYYGVLTEKANHYGSGLVAPVLSGLLLTAVTAALMVVAAFVSAHTETAREAHLRARLRQVRRTMRSLQRAGAPRAASSRETLRAVSDQAEEETPPAA